MLIYFPRSALCRETEVPLKLDHVPKPQGSTKVKTNPLDIEFNADTDAIDNC